MTRIISIVGGLQPSTPTIGTATAGDTTASVVFTPSTYIGKDTITYTATSSPGGFTGTGATSPITVSGLTNGTAYTFTVTGTTNYGVSSLASAASNSITPAAQGSFDSIATTTLGSAASSITLSGFSTSYQHLLIRATMMPVSGGEVEGGIRFNGSSSTVYNSMESIGDGGSQASLKWFGFSYFAVSYTYGTYLATNTPTIVNFLVPNYSSTSKRKTAIGWWGTTGPSVGAATNMAWSYNDTPAINEVQILVTAGTNFAAGTKLQVYGIKGS